MLHHHVKDWLATTADETVEKAIGWSHINSGTRNLAGISTMQDLVRAELERLSFACALEESDPVTSISDQGEPEVLHFGPVLRAQLRPEATRRLLCVGHVDTVYPESHPFQSVTRIGNGHLNGPGIADMKGGLAILFRAFEAVERFGLMPDMGIDVLINSDEETGSLASARHLTAAAQGVEAGLVVEPALADGSLAGGRGGSGNFHFAFKGRAAHAGRAFHEGRNAITAAARLIADVDGLNGQRERTTFNVGLMRGGDSLNSVAASAVVRVNIRSPEPHHMAWAEQELRRIAEHHNGQADVEVALHGAVHRPAKPMTDNHAQLFHRVHALGVEQGLDVTWSDTGGVCDGNNIAAGGIPVVDTLGVRGGAIHSADEFAVEDSFLERVLLLTSVLVSFQDAPLSNGDMTC
ncbi:hydrolase [Coralliovum pocilloporae]|uniref:hydrolase n=1 Tax=Coralliovum pocilloporae TaxID=3066369 RepID=UPI003307B2C8